MIRRHLRMRGSRAFSLYGVVRSSWAVWAACFVLYGEGGISVIENVSQLFKMVSDKVGDSSRVRILKGSFNSGSYPSLPGLLEAQNEEYLSLRTARSEEHT